MKSAIFVVGAIGCDAIDDLTRVRTKVPRDEYRGEDRHRIGSVLNDFLKNSHGNTKSCAQFSAKELQALQIQLHGHREEIHDQIYRDSDDNRALRFASIDDFQAHWQRMGSHASTHKYVAEMQRDAHCLETVMWWTHHLSEAKRATLKHITLPRMPLQHWRVPIDEEGTAAHTVYHEQYHPSSTCLACHGGGIPWQTDDVQPPPLPRQVNGNDRKRRCDEWYGEDEGGVCNACEGLAGSYWGDWPDEAIYPECELVDGPTDVRPHVFPDRFSIEMRGADRWPRSSPSRNATCNFTTDCSPWDPDQEGKPIPPQVSAHWYANLHGILYVDHNPGQFGGGMLRHESVYEMPAGRLGAERALAGLNGIENKHYSELHVQTVKMAESSISGPMLNLVHLNITDLNASGVDDTHLDWRRIPAEDGICVCVEDPAGLPNFVGALDNATYKGRVKLLPLWWKEIGTYSPGQATEPIIADVWSKWTFRFVAEAGTQKPVMFSSPYGGVAMYGNMSNDPSDVWPEEMGGGWNHIPGRDHCFDPTTASGPGFAVCKDYTPPATLTV